ncbi:MAG TPA: hypothetical protein PKC84_13935 [Paracoccaceae bacterium]|nr:hypothetical protein [Paracoccaceae bacterium]
MTPDRPTRSPVPDDARRSQAGVWCFAILLSGLGLTFVATLDMAERHRPAFLSVLHAGR